MARVKTKLEKVRKHVKEDIKDWKHEAKKDRELLHEIGSGKKHPKKKKEKEHKDKKHDPKSPAKNKMKVVMEEFKEGKLRSGSKHGARVTNPRQAVAIAYSEARKAKKKKR